MYILKYSVHFVSINSEHTLRISINHQCNIFPMTLSVRCRSVGEFVVWVCHTFLKGREVTPPCSYRTTYFFATLQINWWICVQGALNLRPVRLDLCTIIIVDVMVHINKIPSRKGEIYDVNPDLININVMNSCFVYMSSSIND